MLNIQPISIPLVLRPFESCKWMIKNLCLNVKTTGRIQLKFTHKFSDIGARIELFVNNRHYCNNAYKQTAELCFMCLTLPCIVNIIFFSVLFSCICSHPQCCNFKFLTKSVEPTSCQMLQSQAIKLSSSNLILRDYYHILI